MKEKLSLSLLLCEQMNSELKLQGNVPSIRVNREHYNFLKKLEGELS